MNIVTKTLVTAMGVFAGLVITSLITGKSAELNLSFNGKTIIAMGRKA